MTKVKTSPQISKTPSAVQMAQELINSKPDLFKNDTDTLLAIAGKMFDYKAAWDELLSKIRASAPADPLGDVKNQIKGIMPILQDMEEGFEYLHSKEESIMNRGIDADNNRFIF